MEYSARVQWRRSAATPFNAKSFDRTHKIYFGSGFSIEACSAPEFLGRSDLPNPEEMFVASISSCFMLTFLYWAAAEGMTVDHYVDDAVGILAKNESNKMAITEVILQPKITFQNKRELPPEVMSALLQKAHDNCFISASVKTIVTIKTKQPALA
ncbi:MAG: OsmC family protein [Gammaproteobacteria bacterium]|nr:OsmC family protein [Gammaproteobacteria bacterium]